MKLTKTVVDHLDAPSTGQAFVRDDWLKGFAVRVTAAGTGKYGHLEFCQ